MFKDAEEPRLPRQVLPRDGPTDHADPLPMRSPLLLFILTLPAALQAEPALLNREYRSPHDNEGFQEPLKYQEKIPEPGTMPSLEVSSLNQKGFLHRGRREAEPLTGEPLILREGVRIYSPSQSFLAVEEEEQALLILHPQTSISAQPQDSGWLYALTGDRGLIRISTHTRELALELKPTDAASPWQGHRLLVNSGSDLYLRYEGDSLTLYVLRGRIRYRIDPTVLLDSVRAPGLLREWEQKQLQIKPKAPYEITVYAGQELSFFPGSTLGFLIGLPNPDMWQAPVLKTSPQIAGTIEANNKLAAFRERWLHLWLGVTSGELIPLQLMQEGRWEEALFLLKDTDPILSSICLYRLQQEDLAQKKGGAGDLVKQESLRSQMRRGVLREIKVPKDLRHSRFADEELYLLATSQQAQGRWRLALDLWEHWPETSIDPPLQLSYREWREHLDQKKPWSWEGSVGLGWTSNALHLQAGEAAPPEVGHRSSWFVSSAQKLFYLIERSDAFLIQGEGYLSLTGFQYSGLADVNQVEGGAALPVRFLDVSVRPFLGRLMAGSAGGLDRFGYEVEWQLRSWKWQPTFHLTQEQNLDFMPTAPHRLDALSGEATTAMDRSVRRNTLGVRTEMLGFYWQSWDYRYALAQADDRNRLVLEGHYQKEFSYDILLKTSGSWRQDVFEQGRASESGLHLTLESSWLKWNRLQPNFKVDYDQIFRETRWILGVRNHW